ncbi:MAG: ATP-dependent helicase [Solirubrobacterales bacterium]|nr:ATP-dependent helicase [Solirubrobacterales bacterium]
MDGWQEGTFLLNAAPGAGKTRPSIELARRLLASGAISRVAVVCPTSPLTRQWAQAAGRLGLHLQPDAPDVNPPRDFHGVAVTYARVAGSVAGFLRTCTPGTLVIADEVHHLGDELAWGTAFEKAFAPATRRLLLSGTPFRSDATPIPGVTYGNDGVARPDFTYGYDDAVRDRICRPVTFIPFDGTLSWQSGDDVIEAGFNDVLTGRESSRRYRTAISVQLENGLPRILREAHERLELLRKTGGHRDAGGLVIAADSQHAAQVAKVLRDVSGEAPTVVLHTDARAHAKLEEFRKGTKRWIVAVNMVSEGVDIPRLRVGVYATAAKTALIFRQIVGRFVRVIPGRPLEESWLYLPGDPVLQGHAADVERELLHVLAPAGSIDGLLDEPPDRTETEPSETPHFVPLSADVAPQMALFGGGPPAPAVAPPVAPAVAEPEPASAVSAFERRKRLREDRRRLVSDLGRKQGKPPAEVNAWVNGRIGVPRVQDATIEQLERSIDLLFDELRSSGRRRAAAR